MRFLCDYKMVLGNAMTILNMYWYLHSFKNFEF